MEYEAQTHNVKLRPSTAQKLNLYKAQFLGLSDNISDAIDDAIRKAYELESLNKQSNE